jgi:hypothetical protein
MTMSELRLLAPKKTESPSTIHAAQEDFTVLLTLAVQNRDRDRATSLVGAGAKGSVPVPPPSAGRLPRADARARHGAASVPPRRPELIAVPRRLALRGSRGMASPEAQMMANCPVLYFDDQEYDGDPPVLRLLRWSAEALALWLSGVCGRRDPEPDTCVCRRCDGPANAWFGGRGNNPHVSRAPYFPTP